MKRGLGWRQDPPKSTDRDGTALLAAAAYRGAPPRAHSLRSQVLSVLDQGSLGSCVAQSVHQALRVVYGRKLQAIVDSGAARGPVTPHLGSRLFTYFLARAAHGDTLFDTGTHIRAALDACRKLGWPPEAVWPYTQRFDAMPSANAFRHAADQRRDFAYYRVRSGLELRTAISSGCPVVFGTEVTEGFVAGSLDFTRPITRDAGGELVGGHAMTAVGYDEQTVEVVNSWGTGWGDAGYFRCELDFVLHARDLWAITGA